MNKLLFLSSKWKTCSRVPALFPWAIPTMWNSRVGQNKMNFIQFNLTLYDNYKCIQTVNVNEWIGQKYWWRYQITIIIFWHKYNLTQMNWKDAGDENLLNKNYLLIILTSINLINDFISLATHSHINCITHRTQQNIDKLYRVSCKQHNIITSWFW